jgi:hypothetical protein
MEDETRRFKIMVFVGLLFVLSAYSSCQEIKYSIWGKTAEATISSTQRMRMRRTRTVLVVRYEFTEESGAQRTDSMAQPLDWQPPADGKLSIDYLAGAKGESRLHGEWNFIAVSFFLVMLGTMVFFVVKTFRSAYA